jgi:hypothetical protein
VQIGFDYGHATWGDMPRQRWIELVVSQRWSVLRDEHRHVEQVVKFASLRPALLVQEANGDEQALVIGTDVATHLIITRQTLMMSVAGESVEAVEAALTRFRALYPPAEPAQTQATCVRFWYLGAHGPLSISRLLAMPTWVEVERNYPDRVRSVLRALLTEFRPSSAGQLLLWQGQPGTGKTYALRALMREWNRWCDMHVVMDPERFFGTQPDYVMQCVLSGDVPMPDGSAPPKDRWRLLILEDAGELLMTDARERTGQGLSRLLNLVDGLLGQGLRLLVLITTNEEIAKIHPAVARPGRCAARLEFLPFGREEARRWLEAHDTDGQLTGEGPPARVTLAELYARLRQTPAPDVSRDSIPVGFK